MESKDFPMFLGKSGKYEIHPPKLCASLTWREEGGCMPPLGRNRHRKCDSASEAPTEIKRPEPSNRNELLSPARRAQQHDDPDVLRDDVQPRPHVHLGSSAVSSEVAAEN